MNNEVNEQVFAMLGILERRLANIEKNVATIGDAVIKTHNRDGELIKSGLLALQFFLDHYLEPLRASKENKST